MSRGSAATTSNATEIYGNEGFGIFTGEGRASVFGQTHIHDNLCGGVTGLLGASVVVFGEAVIENNGNTTDTSHRYFRLHSGVSAYFGSNLFISGPFAGGPTIQNNFGPGIVLDLNSNGQFENLTVQGNSEGGLNVLHQSVAELLPGNTVFAGNLSTGGDTDCDGTSLLFGDMTNVDANKCAQAEGTKKK